MVSMLINRISRFVRNPFFLVAFVLWIFFFTFGPRFLSKWSSGEEDLSNVQALPDLKRHWLLRNSQSVAGADKAAAVPPKPDARGPPRNLSRTGRAPTCRNSQQGVTLLVDEHGYLCERHQLQSSGCCPRPTVRRRYLCHSCNRHNCCSVYEYCVSCCLNPNKRDLLHRALRAALDSMPAAGGHKVLLLSLADQFELCLAKCRTSSASVHHENQYRDANAKHCYGPTPPMLITTID